MRKALNIAGTALLALLIAAVLPLTLPKLFGYQLFNVLSGSMEPGIPVNSVIYVKSCEPSGLQSGDVITFRLGSGTELVETHRVVSVDTAAGTVTTKGDANASADQTQVKFDNVVGIVVFHIPWLGLFAEFLHTPQGIAACIAVMAAAALLWLIADRLKPKERAE